MKRLLLVFSLLVIFLPFNVWAASTSLDEINQRVSDRFETDVIKLSAIMEELRRRNGITETRVAFGGVDTQIKAADYSITSAAEAVAYQRAQKYSSQNQLKNSLLVLRNKILKAKGEVAKALDE